MSDEMDKQTIEDIKTGLLQRRSEIVKELDELNGGTENGNKIKFPEYGDKIDENAQEIGEYGALLATDKVLANSLRDIDKTLDRIEKGTYGICKYCQKPIPKKRLLARPEASACVECKTKLQNS
jgi:DnaK suppressor protein